MDTTLNTPIDELLTRIREADEKLAPEERLKLLQELNVLVKELDSQVVTLKQEIGEEKQV